MLKNIFLNFILFMLVFLPSAFASSLSGTSQLPVKDILVQLLNFSLFFICLFVLIRKTVQAFVQKRREEFFQFEKQAKTLEQDLKQELESWNQKINEAQQQENSLQQQAEQEGAKFLLKKQQELKELKTRLKTETDFFLKLEKSSLQKDVLKKWKDKLIFLSRNQLTTQAKSKELQQQAYNNTLKQIQNL